MTVIYLARPIDQAGGTTSTYLSAAASVVTGALVVRGMTVFDPTAPWYNPTPVDHRANRAKAAVNAAAQAAADATVCLLPKGVPTLGVPAEIEKALMIGQPCVVFTDIESVQISQWAEEGAVIRGIELVSEAGSLVESFLKIRDRYALPNLRQQIAVVVSGGGTTPTRAHVGDAGYDLYVSEDTMLPAGAYIEVPTSVRIGLPPGTWAMLVGRSSSAARGLLVNQAIIDNGYTGHMWFGVTNINRAAVEVKRGERLAQLIPMPLLAPDLPVANVGSLLDTDRGSAGFGSSGR